MEFNIEYVFRGTWLLFYQLVTELTCDKSDLPILFPYPRIYPGISAPICPPRVYSCINMLTTNPYRAIFVCLYTCPRMSGSCVLTRIRHSYMCDLKRKFKNHLLVWVLKLKPY